ncbi:MAG TPA: hypothetical protein VFV99_16960 [Kofleriaceae bacterium]|nr:hypothetical protein [Kofleriaceae bacterium]
MSARTDVLLWANRVIARKGSAAHVLLEVTEQATPQQVQDAFHKIARTSHPDLHRHGLSNDELELVTSAYAAVAGAYQEMRMLQSARVRAALAKPPSDPPTPRSGASTPTGGARTVHPRAGTDSGLPPIRQRAGTNSDAPRGRAGTDSDAPMRPGNVHATGSSPPGTFTPEEPAAKPHDPAHAMSSKALLYYRKAEVCKKKGDLRGAMLQLKLACATDPTSSFLRTALADVETELRSKP